MRFARAVTCALSFAAAGCGGMGRGLVQSRAAGAQSHGDDTHAGPADAPDAPGEPYPWQPTTRSPQTAAAPRDDFARACARHDAALDRVAAFVAERERAGGAPADAELVTDAMRAEGAPYVWPHLWVLAGRRLGDDAPARFETWLAALPHVNELRCGGALARGANAEVAVGVAVDVLADLEALPTDVRAGAWLDVRADMLVPASAAEVLVLGPRGAPHGVPTSFDGGHVRARFNVDRDGAWLVQVLATVEGGPRPVAEAVVFGGTAPATLAPSRAAPGENAGGARDPQTALRAMISGARESENLAPLARDARLDRVAQAHAEAMRDAHRLAHEGADGSPADRVAQAGIGARAVGENVAHAADVKQAHRTLWQSPSHRSNLLETRFDSLGVGVARDADETLWVCEVFAELGPH